MSLTELPLAAPHTQEAPAGMEGAPVVLDTCVLVADPDALFAFGTSPVVVPLEVVEELDDLKTRDGQVGAAARAATRNIEQLRAAGDGNLRAPVPLSSGGTLVVCDPAAPEACERLGLDPTKVDNRILAAAKAFDPPVRLVSADTAMRIKAAQLGLTAEAYEHTSRPRLSSTHPGWWELEVPAAVIDTLYAEKQVSLDELDPTVVAAFDGTADNEFLVLRSGRQSALARRRSGRLTVVPKHRAWDLTPRSKEQQFALDLLMDPDVPIVALEGQAGTGKTICALAAALEQVFEPTAQRYDRLMVLRPLVSVGRADVGFLPGDLGEKLGPWFEAIIDTLVALGNDVSHREARTQLEMWEAEETLTLESVTYLRGRSLQRTLVLVDEAQNLEPLVLKAIITRLGEGSKVVFLGDTSQIDSPWLSETTNALAVARDALAGSELFGHLTLARCERSAVAELAAARL